MNILLVPGAWTGSWIWSEVASHLRQAGHAVFPIELSGLRGPGTRATTRLRDHVDEVVGFIDAEELHAAVLVGHSYSGMVVGQAAVRARDLIKRTIFVEAFLPMNGKSLLQVSGLDEDHEVQLIRANDGYWPAPTMEELREQPHLSEDSIRLLAANLKDHPGKTIRDPAVLEGTLADLTASLIAGPGWLEHSPEADLLASLRGQPSWDFRTLEGGHWPMLTQPEALARSLVDSCRLG